MFCSKKLFNVNVFSCELLSIKWNVSLNIQRKPSKQRSVTEDIQNDDEDKNCKHRISNILQIDN